MKTTLYLVRHAEAIGNIKRIFHGWTDSQITEKGHIQAKRLADSLKDFEIDTIYSSSLRRTMQTAEYIAKEKKLSLILSDQLKEINGGDWENVNWDNIPEKWPQEYKTWDKTPHIHQMPNGESMCKFQKRIINEISIIINENLGKKICILTHGTAIKTLICYFNNVGLEEMNNIIWHDNTSLTIVEKENDYFKVIKEGDISHLDKEQSTVMNQDWWQDYYRKIKK